MSSTYAFAKGHGTENDFVLLLDPDATVHGDLPAERVRALCDRRAGIGADGVLRLLRNADGWFMDYRNGDGSVAEMCGNGVRVAARFLIEEGLVDPAEPLELGTRGGPKLVTPDPADPSLLCVDMGPATVLGRSVVGVEHREWSATHVDMGNPHAVAWVDDLAEAGSLLTAPRHDPGVYPDGVNVEFVVRRGPRHVAMRVHERGSGETRSCGTGACAVAVVATLDDDPDGGARDLEYRVDVPGGTLRLVYRSDGHVLMTGPALIVARGTTCL